jgi:hypothetical protein
MVDGSTRVLCVDGGVPKTANEMGNGKTRATTMCPAFSHVLAGAVTHTTGGRGMRVGYKCGVNAVSTPSVFLWVRNNTRNRLLVIATPSMPKHSFTFKHLLGESSTTPHARREDTRERSVNDLLTSSRQAGPSVPRDRPPHLATTVAWTPAPEGVADLDRASVHPWVGVLLIPTATLTLCAEQSSSVENRLRTRKPPGLSLDPPHRDPGDRQPRTRRKRWLLRHPTRW